jgi:hypothetical protein
MRGAAAVAVVLTPPLAVPEVTLGDEDLELHGTS